MNGQQHEWGPSTAKELDEYQLRNPNSSREVRLVTRKYCDTETEKQTTAHCRYLTQMLRYAGCPLQRPTAVPRALREDDSLKNTNKRVSRASHETIRTTSSQTRRQKGRHNTIEIVAGDANVGERVDRRSNGTLKAIQGISSWNVYGRIRRRSAGEIWVYFWELLQPVFAM